MTKTSELGHLFRSLKAPAAARAMPKLAERNVASTDFRCACIAGTSSFQAWLML